MLKLQGEENPTHLPDAILETIQSSTVNWMNRLSIQTKFSSATGTFTETIQTPRNKCFEQFFHFFNHDQFQSVVS